MTEVFIIIKPDAIERGLTAVIIQRFLQIGEIEWIIGKYKKRTWCRSQYNHLFMVPESDDEYPFVAPDLVDAYAYMETFMSETLLIGLLLRGHNCIEKARKMAGATDPKEAARGTIRSDYGLAIRPICHNLVHVADSPEAVRREVRLFLNRSTDHDW